MWDAGRTLVGHVAQCYKCPISTMGDGMAEKLTFILSEVSEIADVQRDTMRMWERRGLIDLGDGGSQGWRRFSGADALRVGAYAAIVKATKDHEIANQIQRVVKQYASQLQDGVIGDCLWAIVYRTEAGDIEETLIEDNDEAFNFFRELMTGVAAINCRAAWMFNISGIYRDLAVRIMGVVNARVTPKAASSP